MKSGAARLRHSSALRNIAALLFFLCLLGQQGVCQQRPLAARIEIDASKVEGRISPLLYGQFMEFMFEGIKNGLHAELIRDRSFEEAVNAIGLPRHWERYPDDRHGLYQSGIPVRKGVEYHGYLWMKANGYEGRVTVALEADVSDGATYAEAEIKNIRGDWKKYEFTLKPDRTDPLARFAILADGRGKLWVDQVSLIPGDAVGGVRADVFQKVRELRPAFIRWPGGNVAQDYHWMWGVGPRDRRKTWVNLSWKNEPEPSDFGTDEFVAFARAVGAEPSITVNVEGRGATVEEAAAWVEYCNGPATSRYGALRAANGHPEPYRVKYWEVGNEIWGPWVRGHSDGETYARNYKRYHEAMRA